MLRTVVFFIALLVTLGGLFALSQGYRAALPPTIWGAVLLIALIVERWRYRSAQQAHEDIASDWKSTGEQFIDPETGKPMQVLFNAITGERRYVSMDGQENS